MVAGKMVNAMNRLCFPAASSGFKMCAVLVVLATSGLACASSNQVNERQKLPLRKTGLWEVTIQSHSPSGISGVKQGAMVVQQCTDAKAERVLPFFVFPASQECSAASVTQLKEKGGYSASAMCKTHENPFTLRMQIWGDPQSVYAGTYSIEYPKNPLRNTGKVGFQGRWLGKCKAGQQPGDVVLPNGITVNPVNDANKASEHSH